MDYDEKLRIKNKDGSLGKAYGNGKWILKPWLNQWQNILALLNFVF